MNAWLEERENLIRVLFALLRHGIERPSQMDAEQFSAQMHDLLREIERLGVAGERGDGAGGPRALEERDRQRRLPLYGAVIDALKRDSESEAEEAAERYYAALDSARFADESNRDSAVLRDAFVFHRQKRLQEGRND